jgi:hypothetical protein
MIINTFNILLIIFIFLVILTLCKTIKDSRIENFENNNAQLTNPIKYIKCNYKPVKEYLKTVFEKIKFERINESRTDWNLYLPCGYNFIEQELLTIKNIDKNKFIFGIKGCDKIASKNELWRQVETFYGRKKASTLIPESFIINNPEHIRFFKVKFNKNKIYYLKKNIQRKKGILITNNYNEILDIINSTRKKIKEYHNSKLFNIQIVKDEKNNKNQNFNTLLDLFKIIQINVDNLFLIRKRKLNLRLYIVITCKNYKKHMYLYKKGKCIYANKITSEDNLDLEENLTSYNLDKQIYANHPETLEQLKNYMTEKKYNILFKRIHIMFKEIFLAVKNNICKNSELNKGTTFQLFGCDVIFNTKLHPYLLEFNKGPAMKFITKVDKEMKLQLLEDTFKLVGLGNKKTDNFIKLN